MAAASFAPRPAAGRRISLAEIDAAVSARLGATRGLGNSQPACFNRQVAMYLAKYISSSPAQTAQAFEKWDEVLNLVIRETAHLREINEQLAAAQKLTSGGEWEKLDDLRRAAEDESGAIKSLAESQQGDATTAR